MRHSCCVYKACMRCISKYSVISHTMSKVADLSNFYEGQIVIIKLLEMLISERGILVGCSHSIIVRDVLKIVYGWWNEACSTSGVSFVAHWFGRRAGIVTHNSSWPKSLKSCQHLRCKKCFWTHSDMPIFAYVYIQPAAEVLSECELSDSMKWCKEVTACTDSKAESM